MATLSPGPICKPDGTPVPDDQPESLPGQNNPKAPVIKPGDPGDAPSDSSPLRCS